MPVFPCSITTRSSKVTQGPLMSSSRPSSTTLRAITLQSCTISWVIFSGNCPGFFGISGFLIWKIISGFWRQRQSSKPNLCFIRFEDMKSDLGSVVKEVSSFLGCPVQEALLPQLTDHLSFKQMKSNSAANKTDFVKVTIHGPSFRVNMGPLCQPRFLLNSMFYRWFKGS